MAEHPRCDCHDCTERRFFGDTQTMAFHRSLATVEREGECAHSQRYWADGKMHCWVCRAERAERALADAERQVACLYHPAFLGAVETAVYWTRETDDGPVSASDRASFARAVRVILDGVAAARPARPR